MFFPPNSKDFAHRESFCSRSKWIINFAMMPRSSALVRFGFIPRWTAYKLDCSRMISNNSRVNIFWNIPEDFQILGFHALLLMVEIFWNWDCTFLFLDSTFYSFSDALFWSRKGPAWTGEAAREQRRHSRDGGDYLRDYESSFFSGRGCCRTAKTPLRSTETPLRTTETPLMTAGTPPGTAETPPGTAETSPASLCFGWNIGFLCL